MKKIIGILFGVFLLSQFFACDSRLANSGFEGSDIFVNDFHERSRLFEDTSFLSILSRDLSVERRQALQFLYAYMPLPDIADYSGDFHLMNVDYALKARAEMPWGASLPDREFLHFVLPVRVNNENLDESRRVFYEELKERVCSLSMYDAVLEVNHWCHEKVTYTPSDIRTSAPLATVRTAYGRCGEESTFTVAALRAVGIPARQVYTPRWAHTDNNHAWVEAWVDGEWHFLGACEPEPVLDLGWFNAPASRGMLMHTNAFGNYNGPEEVVGSTNCTTEINVTSNYAPTSTTTVRVVDENGNVQKAKVDFKIYNYAEFYTAASKECDDNGCASLTTGCGDMIAWAYKDGKFGFGKFTAGKTDTITVILDKQPGFSHTFEMDIVPPVERNTTPKLTPEQIRVNTERFAREDSIRNAYVATFPTEADAKRLAAEIGVENEYIIPLLKDSRGNHATIVSFLKEVGKDKEQLGKALGLLNVISKKDLRDITLEVLNDHFANTPVYESTGLKEKALYERFILNPRVSNELLTPYKSFFAEAVSADDATKYRSNPELWVEWCRANIKENGDWNPLKLCMSPKGVWNMRVADSHSRDIFFVSSARSMGIPARIDEVTGKTQYMSAGHWHDVDFGATATEPLAAQGKLYAKYKPTQFMDNPRYYSHFSISKIVDGRLVLQNYPESATWSSLLRTGTDVDEGNYLLMSGTRMANGSVLAHLDFVNITAGKDTNIDLVLRESKDDLQVIGEFNSENIFYDLASEQKRSLLSATGRGYYIIALIDPTNEPTNHFLRDVMPYKERFEQWGQKMVLLFRDSSAAERFKADDFPGLPSTIVMGTDVDNVIYDEIIRNMKLKSPNMPVILVADTFNRVVFLSQGYSIGLGEQLVKVINQLNE